MGYPHWPLVKGLAKLHNRGFPIPKFLCKWELEVAAMEKYVNETIDGVIAQRIRDGAKTKYSVTSGKEQASPKAGSPSPKVSSPKGGSSPGRSPKRNSSLLDETKRLDAVEMFMNVEPPLSAVELRDVVKGLILGGRDTTGVSIMWTLYEISKNPNVEARLWQECKDMPTDDPVAFYEATRKSKFLDAVIRETIRLYSPVPLDAKKAAKDDVMPDGTFVGEGWVVVYAPYVMARDKEQWGPDAAEWKPSRWMEGELAVKEPSPFVYSAFQAGPRICLGKRSRPSGGKVMCSIVDEGRCKVALMAWCSCPVLQDGYDVGHRSECGTPHEGGFRRRQQDAIRTDKDDHFHANSGIWMTSQDHFQTNGVWMTSQDV